MILIAMSGFHMKIDFEDRFGLHVFRAPHVSLLCSDLSLGLAVKQLLFESCRSVDPVPPIPGPNPEPVGRWLRTFVLRIACERKIEKEKINLNSEIG